MGYSISCCPVEKTPVLAQAAAQAAQTKEDSREGTVQQETFEGENFL